MCRTIKEANVLGQDRIRCDLPGCNGYEAKKSLAAANRREARRVRRDMAVYARDALGGDQKIKRAIMNTRPRELAIMVARMREIDPQFADELMEASGTDRLPGLHNMTMQDSRRESVRLDYDEVGELKDDPGMVSMSARQISRMETAYLSSDLARERLSPGKLAELQRSASVRAEMDSLGLLGSVDERGRHVPPPSVEDMNAAQLGFYAETTPEMLARVGDVENTIEDQFVSYAMTNVTFSPARRGRLCTEEQAGLTSVEIAEDPDFAKTGVFHVREGVDMIENPRYDPEDPDSLEPQHLFAVDGKIELPVDPDASIGDQTNAIVSVSRLSQRGEFEGAPLNQKSLYDRMLDPGTPTGQRIQDRINEDIIRATFTAGKIPGIDTSIDVSADEIAHRSGRRPGPHTLSEVFGSKSALSGKTRDAVGRSLAATIQELSPEMAKKGYSELAHGQLKNSQRAAKRRASQARRRRQVWEGRSIETGTKSPRISKRGHDLGDVTTSRGIKEREHRKNIVPGIKKLRETEGFKKTPSLPSDPDKAHKMRTVPTEINRLVGPNKTATNADIELLVAQANRAAKAEFVDSAPTDAHVAHTRLLRADEARRFNRDAAAKERRSVPAAERPKLAAPITLEQYVVVPDSTHGHNTFREGRSFQNNGYAVATTTRGKMPKAGPGEKVIRVVYSTREAMPGTETHAIMSPESVFRVLRRSKGSGGVETVHVADQGMVLDAARA